MSCEHELFCTEEKTLSEDRIKVTMECSLCQAKFKGVLKEDDR